MNEFIRVLAKVVIGIAGVVVALILVFLVILIWCLKG